MQKNIDNEMELVYMGVLHEWDSSEYTPRYMPQSLSNGSLFSGLRFQ